MRYLLIMRYHLIIIFNHNSVRTMSSTAMCKRLDFIKYFNIHT